MPAITIMAVVDGTIACVTVQMDKLDWMSIDAARTVRVNSLPHRIVDVTICTDKGAFRHVIPDLAVEREERTSWWKRWWKSVND